MAGQLYLVHIERLDIRCDNFRVPHSKSDSFHLENDSWNWYSRMSILCSKKIEPLYKPLESIEVKFASFEGYNTLIDECKTLYPNESMGVTTTQELETKRFEGRKVDILRRRFSPALQPNQCYWIERFSSTLQEKSNRVLKDTRSYHGNQGYKDNFLLGANFLPKHMSISMRFDKWFPLQPPVFDGKETPFAIAFVHKKSFLSEGKIDNTVVDFEETKRIQQGFRLLELPSENVLTVDINNPLSGKGYGIYWRIPSNTVLNRHYPGK